MKNRIFAALLAVLLVCMAAAFCSCDSSGTSNPAPPVKVGGDYNDDETLGTDTISQALYDTLGRDAGNGKYYLYEIYGQYDTEDESYYIFRCCEQLIVDGVEHKTPVDYIFVEFNGEKTFRGSYNEQTGEANFSKKLDIYYW